MCSLGGAVLGDARDLGFEQRDTAIELGERVTVETLAGEKAGYSEIIVRSG